MKQVLINEKDENISQTEKVSYEKPYVLNISKLPQKFETKTRISGQYLISILIVGLCLMGIFPISVMLFSLNIINSLMLGTGILIFFISVLFFLLIPKKIVNVENTIIRDIAHPTIKEINKPIIVYVDRPVERIVEKPVEVVRFKERKIVEYVDRPIEVEKIVEKPIIKEVTKYVERPVIQYLPQQKVKLNIKKYKYVGSSKSKRFHKKSCRLSKLIKKKQKVNSNSIVIYKKKRFKACKVCLKNL